MHRRTVLAAFAQLPFLAMAASASSAPAEVRPWLKTQARDALGTTLVLGLPQAPFAGVEHGDDTVIVFVPQRYRFQAEEGISALVHFHGHNSSAERALAAHALREQLVDSRQNAVLVVPGIRRPNGVAVRAEHVNLPAATDDERISERPDCANHRLT